MTRGEEEIASGEDARVELDVDHFTVGGGFGRAHVIAYRNVAGLESRDYRVRVPLVTGEELTFYHLGHDHDGFVRDLNDRRNEGIIRDLLMYESVVVEGVRADYVLEDGDGTHRGSGQLRLYASALVLSSQGEGVVRIPYGLISDVSPGDYSLAVTTEYGTSITFSGMGKAHRYFVDEFSKILDGLAARTAEELDEMLPELGPQAIGHLTPHLRDGRAGRRSELESLAPGIWDAFRRRMAELECLEYYDFLRSLSHTEEAYLGTKRGLMGNPEDHYVWFLMPFLGPAPGPGNAVAMEVAGGEGGRATYFFQLVGRDAYPDLSGEALEDAVEEAVAEINRCMMSINFRREPIYLPADRLGEPRYARYAAAVASMPSLRHLRDRFIGRVIHRSTEGWQRDVLDLLTFNTSTRDDSARWRGDPEPEGGSAC